ncbi:CgeB family protein [Prosthecomicrobium pneumaticum]|uniref:Spore maturation protein CgeB n=1 Tax=Prosthecomicrobium pneumaticum TaxID=81895 RepID=A0A7W9CTT8_9HYPH|nr:glycosyltransferase [Prosthecomicrobium pneumaticum]MBB5751524.1 spore maturation protein CgeB [Prosthecomicrobium pneumaticum]
MRPLDIVFIGLSLSSSWGNGHATTFRGLMRGLAAAGHRLTFLERDMPWYAANRDLPEPDFCSLIYYETVAALHEELDETIKRADAVVIGSYVPEGVAVIDLVTAMATGPVAFYDIDTPVTLARMAAGERDYLAPGQIPLFDVYLSFTGGPTLERLERHFGAHRAAPLYCAVDAGRYRPTGEPIRWDLGYLGTYSPDRQPTLEALLIEPARRLPWRRFVVAGPQYPEDIDWPENVERIAHLPPAEHPSFFSRQRFTLNVTRADMIAAGWSPSVRLFEAAACGTPIVSDRWRGLSDFFPVGTAILTADGPDTVVQILTGTGEAERTAIAAAARARVLARHTGTVRAGELEAELRAAIARRAAHPPPGRVAAG